MKAIDFLKNAEIKTLLDEFFDLNELTDREREKVALFALVVEMKRLRENNHPLKNTGTYEITTPVPNINPWCNVQDLANKKACYSEDGNFSLNLSPGEISSVQKVEISKVDDSNTTYLMGDELIWTDPMTGESQNHEALLKALEVGGGSSN